jgi:ABC-type lipoprotein release transport system permease subunit
MILHEAVPKFNITASGLGLLLGHLVGVLVAWNVGSSIEFLSASFLFREDV